MSSIEEINNHKKLDLAFKMLCNYFGYEPDSVRQKTRKREIVVMRQIFYYFAKQHMNRRISLSEMGGYLKQDHTTVLHAHKTIQNLIDTDKSFALEMDEARYFFKKEILPRVEYVDPRSIPANKYQKIKSEKNLQVLKANKMYYTAKSYIARLQKHIDEDPILEGWRRHELELENIKALKKLEELKYYDDLTINSQRISKLAK